MKKLNEVVEGGNVFITQFSYQVFCFRYVHIIFLETGDVNAKPHRIFNFLANLIRCCKIRI